MPEDDSIPSELIARLYDRGIDALVVMSDDDLEFEESEDLPTVALLDVSAMSVTDARHCADHCVKLKIPLIAAVPSKSLSNLDAGLAIDDFIVSPPDADELVARIKRLGNQLEPAESSDVVRMGELAVNPTTYEVSLKGRRINLRFKEYELLRLLITNPGRVYTREALLSQIWGYDYLGGTRTVDVHIRRLRSKIEDADHQFVETIWNVGYRFKDLRE